MGIRTGTPTLIALATLTAWVGASDCLARTWRVHPEFGIQHTIDSAAPGDTILVSAGRYERFWTFTFPGTGDQAPVIAAITKGPLTFIGDDRDTTFLGPVEYLDSVDELGTLLLAIDQAGGPIRFEQLTLRNTRWIANAGATALEVRDCIVTGAETNPAFLLWESVQSIFERCVFTGNDSAIIGGFGGSGNHDLVIADCEFVGHRTAAINLANSFDVMIKACRFEDNIAAIQLHAGSTGTIRDCEFIPREGVGGHIFAQTGAHIQMVNNRLDSGCVQGIAAGGGATIIGEGNRVGWASLKTIEVISPTSHISLTDGVILNGGGWSVYSRSTPASGQPYLDFEDNYWGTTDPDQIREWIWDGEDYEPNLLVDFEPFRTEPLPASTTTMGSLKSRFSGQH